MDGVLRGMRVLALTALLTAATIVLGAARTGVSAPSLSAQLLAAPAMATADTVWYITNRAQRGDAWVNERADLSYGVRTFHVAPLRQDKVSFEVRLDVKSLGASPLASGDFLASLTRSLREAGPERGLLLHVHGYATSINEATEEAAEMRRRGGFRGPMVVFAWPANDIGVTWPASKRLFTHAYWQDSVAAARSANDLARAVETLVREIGAERIVVSAHSMGNQVLAAALHDTALSQQLRRTPLRGLAFVSPDVDREYFRDSVAPSASAQSARVTLYGARNDMLLKLSGTIHNGRPRAGLLEAGVRWPSTLHVVDITDGRAAAFWLGPWADTHHALRREASALVDLFSIVLSNAPVTCRAALGAIQTPSALSSEAAAHWRLTNAVLPRREGMQGGSEPLTCPIAVNDP